MPDVSPFRFRKLGFELGTIVGQYAIDVSDARALRKAAAVLDRLGRANGLGLKDFTKDRPFLFLDKLSEEERLTLHRAQGVLAYTHRTFHLSIEISRLDLYTDLAEIAPWRWLRAAEILTTSERVTDEQADSFPYLTAIARSFHASDRDKLLPACCDAPLTTEDIRASLGTEPSL